MIQFAIRRKLAVCNKAEKIQLINYETTRRIFELGEFLLHDKVRDVKKIYIDIY